VRKGGKKKIMYLQQKREKMTSRGKNAEWWSAVMETRGKGKGKVRLEKMGGGSPYKQKKVPAETQGQSPGREKNNGQSHRGGPKADAGG